MIKEILSYCTVPAMTIVEESITVFSNCERLQEKDQTVKTFNTFSTFHVCFSAKLSLKGFLSPLLILEIRCCQVKQNVSRGKAQVVKISNFYYQRKYEFTENVLRGRCQDANFSVEPVAGWPQTWKTQGI